MGSAFGFGVVLDLLDEVGDDFSVGFSDELVALGGELALEVEVVFDDAVVDDDDAAGAVAMGMGVLFGGAAVGGPAGVADAEGALEGMLAEDLLKIGELAGGAAEFKFVAARGCRRRCRPSHNRGIRGASTPR